jgi:CheY-like chemotaxis protein
MPSVLVVDDDRELREALAESLSEAGYRTQQASHGRQALEKLAFSIPDAILIDVMMPVMNGVELLRALRADPHLCHVPVILMTGVNDSMIGVRLNAPVVTKPNFDALMPILRQYIKSSTAASSDSRSQQREPRLRPYAG